MNAAPQGARRGVRRAVDFECELIGSRSDKIHRYRATDLSVDGLFLNTVNPARAGEHVVVCFKPGEGWQGSELQVFAEVVRVMSVRVRPGALPPDVGMALELLDLTKMEQQQLQEWLKARISPVPRRRRPVARRTLAREVRPLLSVGDAALDAGASLPPEPLQQVVAPRIGTTPGAIVAASARVLQPAHLVCWR